MATKITDFEAGPASVSVIVKTADLVDSESSVKINWSSCGAVSLKDAKRFLQAFERAVRQAEDAEVVNFSHKYG